MTLLFTVGPLSLLVGQEVEGTEQQDADDKDADERRTQYRDVLCVNLRHFRWCLLSRWLHPMKAVHPLPGVPL